MFRLLALRVVGGGGSGEESVLIFEETIELIFCFLIIIIEKNKLLNRVSGETT